MTRQAQSGHSENALRIGNNLLAIPREPTDSALPFPNPAIMTPAQRAAIHCELGYVYVLMSDIAKAKDRYEEGFIEDDQSILPQLGILRTGIQSNSTPDKVAAIERILSRSALSAYAPPN
jgi:hypothetical protein